jgi:hypothetical protein
MHYRVRLSRITTPADATVLNPEMGVAALKLPYRGHHCGSARMVEQNLPLRALGLH